MTEQTTQPSETVQQPPVGTLVVHSDQAVTVNIVSEQSSDTWHKVLDALWDDGILASMPDDAFRVLHAFFRLRKREDGIVSVSIPAITSMVGRSKSYVYSGRAFLLASPHRLLAARADLGRDTYHVLPGWSFAGRTFRDGGKPSTTAESSDQRFRHGGRLSAIAENTPPLHREARARSERIREFVDDDLVGLLTRKTKFNENLGGPFRPDDANGLVRTTDAETIRTAIRNANALAESGGIKKTWRGYVAHQCRQGCSLFATLAQSDDELVRNRDRLLHLLALEGETEKAAMVRAWWNALGGKRQAKAISPSERSRTDEWLWSAIVRKAHDALQRGSFRMPAPTQTA